MPAAKPRSAPFRALRVLTLLGLLLLAGWALSVAAVYIWGERDEARPADAIVVLGAAHYDGRPSPVLRARLDHAVDLWEAGLAPVLITTGGQAPGDTVSEAVVGSRYAERAGVPGGAILTERSGMTTRESMAAVAAIMRERELESAILVSDPFHMLRLKLLARREGIEGYTSPTRTSPISGNPGEERMHVLRESVSLPVSLLTGPL